MDTTLILYCICTFFCVNVAFSQEEKSFELKPYGGLSIPVGDFEEFAEPGINTGLALDHYVKPNIGIGLDLNYQNVGLSAPSNFATFLGANNLQQSGFGNQSMLTFAAGPTVRFGKEKFKTEIYSKAGLSLISVPESSVQFSSIDVFRMEEQEITSFGVVSGLRFNYAINDKISLFANPQYTFTGDQIDVFSRQVDAQTDIGMLEMDEGQLCFHRPSTFGVNGGVAINLIGGKKKKPESAASPTFCNISFDTQCNGENPELIIGGSWSGMNPSYKLRYSISGPFASIVSITNNNLALNAWNGNRFTNPLIFPNAASGSTINAKIEITDASGSIVYCYRSDTIKLPVCKPKPKNCWLDVEVEACTHNSSDINTDITVNWRNQPIGSTVNVSLLDVSLNPIPITLPGNGFTLTSANTTGSHTFPTIDLSAYEGQTIKIKLEICGVGPNGLRRCCEDLIDVSIPSCCYDCTGVSITDNTSVTQKGDGFFEILWTVSPITGQSIQSMLVTLESFGADDYGSIRLPEPNFEISRAGFLTGSFTAKPIGSLANRRSNVWLIEFSPTITGGNFVTAIDVYDYKILRNYYLKVVFYNTDGKRCTQELYFNQ